MSCMQVRTSSTTNSPAGCRRSRAVSRANAWRTGGRSTTGRATMSDAARRGGAEEETEMMANPKRSGALVLRLIVGLALLGWPRVGAAQGTWSVISLPQKPGELYQVAGLAVSVTGDLYVADRSDLYQNTLQKRDAQGNWSVIATYGGAVGQVANPGALAV